MNSGSVASLLFEAASLMLIGMVFVFSFLGLLIVGIHLIARFCEAFPGETAEPSAHLKGPSAHLKGPSANLSRNNQAVQPGIDGNVIAAISAAIHTHRQNSKK
ncbi:MAG: OadG family transporter subunit [Pseudomonadota bacterium]|jgi:oxaloacetate decarboxylase (Na+ extruding) subunit gamma|uniref:OadG family protein n=1 Tax=Alteromonas macleodii TaxID=28108 RepID=UPI002E8B5367|nr:OadG family transporter subunit [Pseudomonadota bacterium]MEE3221346.1 OadG family transporter subunit [Pseudomonadota bacterium]|tara:strand:- start:151 stop:459 length:309 start_codon:yes stop_codon:yes gene_type:complete